MLKLFDYHCSECNTINEYLVEQGTNPESCKTEGCGAPGSKLEKQVGAPGILSGSRGESQGHASESESSEEYRNQPVINVTTGEVISATLKPINTGYCSKDDCNITTYSVKDERTGEYRGFTAQKSPKKETSH